MPFVHLHTHSHYSLLDGLPKIPELVARAKEFGCPALALTDHGVMYGALEFYQECRRQEIKPIVGMEAYMALGEKEEKRAGVDKDYHHLTLLARNEEGYRNLMLLTTLAHLEGYYYKPRIDKAALRAYGKGLIALSGCLRGEIPRLIARGQFDEAKRVAQEFQEIFGKENFFAEVQKHPEIPEQETVNRGMFKLCEELGIVPVATVDSHYLHADDGEAQDVLVCVQTGKFVTDKGRLNMTGVDHSFKSPEEVAAQWKDHPEVIINTLKVAERCNLELTLNQWAFPQFPVPERRTHHEYLEELVWKAAQERFGLKKDSPLLDQRTVLQRIEYELEVIKKTGFSTYFLIVSDYVKWARAQGIVVTTRGSAAGSLVSYLIDITTVNPLDLRLPFERFLTVSRPSPPDIDVDFADNRRDEVIEYVREKYGRDKVAQICTFGTMLPRAAVRDVTRVLGFPYSFGDKLSKMIPPGAQGFHMTVDRALEENPELGKMYHEDANTKRVLNLARKVEGCARHASVHAAGMVIAPTKLTDFTPLQKEAQGDHIITQYDMHAVEAAGLVKMDMLGIRNLSILGDAVQIVKKTKGVSVDIDKLPPEDKKTFEMLSRGDTMGVFQLSGSGMTRYLKELKPSSIHDIMAMVALFRPGPMESIPEYIKRKHNPRLIQYLVPQLQNILERTYGILVYQDDVLMIAIELAGYTWEEADKLRKAMGKKIPREMVAQREKFLSGCVKKGLVRARAEEIWALIEPFAAYGFNKCITGDTIIYDAVSGVRRTVEELYRSSNSKITLLSLEDDLTLDKRPIGAVQQNGVKPIFEVITRRGLRIKATANHPFRKFGSWATLAELKHGDRIATARHAPLPKRAYPIDDYKLAALGYLLAEGNFCHPYGIYYYSKAEEEIADFISHAKQFSNARITIDRSRSAVSVYVGKQNQKQPNGLRSFAQEWELLDCKATSKVFPTFVFLLNREQLCVLLGKMWQGDGCVHSDEGEGQLYYATSSRLLAYDMQHLLLRLGMISTVHEKHFKYRDTVKTGWTIHVSRHTNIKIFEQTVGQYLIGEKRATLSEIVAHHPVLNGAISAWSARGSKDIIPAGVLPIIKSEIIKTEMSLKGFARTHNIAERLLCNDDAKKGYLRETVAVIAEALHSEVLTEFAHSDVYWDEVVSIISRGEAMTYDLTVPETHNFVANDIIVHNSHAASYGMVAYQTAYMKAHWPAEFITAILTAEAGNTDKLAEVIMGAREAGIKVLPPDVNESHKDFTYVDDQTIRFGLLAIKNLGSDVVEAVIEEREQGGAYENLEDFLKRVQHKNLNKKSLESLIKSGAMDCFGDRGVMLENMEAMLAFHRGATAEPSKQSTLFTGLPEVNRLSIKDAPPAAREEKLRWEKELLGLYVTAHPLEEFKQALDGKVTPISALLEVPDRAPLCVAGALTECKTRTTKNGERMAVGRLQDLTGSCEVVAFPKTYKENPGIWSDGALLCVWGRGGGEEKRVVCERAMVLTAESAGQLGSQDPRVLVDKNTMKDPRYPSTQVPNTSSKRLLIHLQNHDRATLETLRTFFASTRGSTPVYIVLSQNGVKRTIQTGFQIDPEERLIRSIEDIVGQGQVVIN
ncbi:DNA polymerase III subunit alpha [Candidatus Uhrbacteria bacterium]|nr:DNA polymerase III subunit alpha [Candidatus Uhrbacteria bacterium]